jgi:K+ transporter
VTTSTFCCDLRHTIYVTAVGARLRPFDAAALPIDYVLVVAVSISAGVGALVSAVPGLQPHTLALCLLILVFISLINLRGVREAGVNCFGPIGLPRPADVDGECSEHPV